MEDKYLPPEEISGESKELWASVVPCRAESPEKLEIVCQALKAKDRAEECSKIIEKEGLQVTTVKSGMNHAHPLIKVEKENRQLFLKAWSRLGFDKDPCKGWEPFYPEPEKK
jgi:hypothetical protein